VKEQFASLVSFADTVISFLMPQADTKFSIWNGYDNAVKWFTEKSELIFSDLRAWADELQDRSNTAVQTCLQIHRNIWLRDTLRSSKAASFVWTVW